MFRYEAPVPPGLLEPSAPWVFDLVIPIFGGAIILAAGADCLRRRRFTWGFLFLFNSMMVFWMETAGDWGQHLLYSPVFAKHHLLDWMPYKTPNDPVFMPFAYAVYWTVHAVIVLYVARWLVQRFNWSLLKAVVVMSLPVNYAWDFFVEASAAALGWWTYDPGFGPVIEFENGGKMTLLWTIGVMSFWPNLMAYWAGKPPIRHLSHFERFFGLERWTRTKPASTTGNSIAPESQTVLAGGAANGVLIGTDHVATSKTQEYDDYLDYEVLIPRWKFELARFGAWFVVFQVSFALVAVFPIVLMRLVTGFDSPYVP